MGVHGVHIFQGVSSLYLTMGLVVVVVYSLSRVQFLQPHGL